MGFQFIFLQWNTFSILHAAYEHILSLQVCVLYGSSCFISIILSFNNKSRDTLNTHAHCDMRAVAKRSLHTLNLAVLRYKSLEWIRMSINRCLFTLAEVSGFVTVRSDDHGMT